ncbi:GRXS15 [Scenedesmus sp. PABB004]|nr:GRXS15 [Scenedesmus sp. PABB004]
MALLLALGARGGRSAAALAPAALAAARGAAAAPRRGLAVVPGDESHDDFKPRYKAEPVGDVEAQIKADVADNQVFIYMKGTPEQPQCGFSSMACQILDAYNFKYGSRNVLADPAVREGVKKFTGWPTIPQVFVKGEFIGGSDILMEMHKAGELGQLADELAEAKQA